MAGADPTDYWLQRMAQAVEDSIGAPGEASRRAYMDLARHYWSMHIVVHGRSRSAPDILMDDSRSRRCAA
jgi:hypothetical protein